MQLKFTKTLYQLDHVGKTRVWTINVNDDGTKAEIVTISGILGGNLITTPTPILKGNGKKTYLEQALFDAKREITVKEKAGYVDDIANVKAKTDTATIKKPMKGECYHPTGKKNNSLTLDKAGLRGKRLGIQRKLDGWRFRAHVTKTDIKFYTSSGDITLTFPQIAAVIREKFDKNIGYWESKYGITEHFLDGEVYTHNLQVVRDAKDNIIDFFYSPNTNGFNAAASACGSGKNKAGQSDLTPMQAKLRAEMQFHIFDVCVQAPYETRQKIANNYVDNKWVLPVETIIIDNADEAQIEKLYVQFLGEAYEGCMIRQLDMPYEFKRTKQLLKYKPETDGEFQIVGCEESIQGNTLGALVLAMPDGRTFRCDLKTDQKNKALGFGSDKNKKYIWDNQPLFLKKWVTVDYMEDTINGLPRNPKAKGLRKGPSAD